MAGRFSIEAIFKAVDRVTAPVTKMQNRVGKFTRSMQRGFRSVDRVVGKMASGMASGLKRGAVAGGAALAAVGVALDGVADKADALAKQSRRLQFPIEELQEWKFAAEQSGVSNELLDKSLGAFTKRLGEMKGGFGPLLAGLKDTNPELLKQLDQTDSVADSFEIYMNAIRNAKTATEKAALANAAFSRSGLALVNITDNSTAAIAALRKEQRENGIITKKQAEDAEAYNDAVNSLQKSLLGFMQTVLIPMMPMLTQLAKQAREWVNANRGVISEKILQFGRDLIDNFQNIVTWAKRIGVALAVFITFSSILKALVLVMTAVNLVMSANPMTLIVLGVVALIAAIAAVIFWWDEIILAAESLPGPILAVFNLIKEIIGTYIDIWVALFNGFAELVAPAFALIADVALAAWQPIKEFFSDLASFVGRIFSIVIDGITGSINAVTNAIKAVRESIPDVGGVIKSVGESASDVGGAVSDFFGFGDDEEEKQSPQGGMVSPQARTARSIEEQRTTSTAEVTLKAEQGTTAEVTGGKLGPGLQLQQTGAF